MYSNPTDTSNSMKLPMDHDGWLMFRFDNHEIIRLDLQPRASIENHTNDWRLVFYVLRGEGTLNIHGETFLLAEGQSIAVQAGKERFWHNTGSVKLELLAIKTKDKG